MSVDPRVRAWLTAAVERFQNGRPAEARRLCDDVLALNAGHPTALNVAGMATHQLGRHGEAVGFFERAVQAAPRDAELWNNLGNALQTCGRQREAFDAFCRAMKLDPRLAEAHNNFGFLLLRDGRHEESLEHFRRAIAVAPDFLLAAHNLSCSLLALKRFDEAIDVLNAAIRRDPRDAGSYVNLGDALRCSDRTDEAIAALESALRIDPKSPEALINLGGVFKDLGRYDEAIDCYERAIASRPRYAEAHWNLAQVLLLRGDLARGWDEFAWCREVPKVAPPNLALDSPAWTGGPLEGKTILLIADQGLGDTLQLIRYAALFRQCGASVVAAVQPSLRALLASAPGVDRVVDDRAPFPPHDCHVFLRFAPRWWTPAVEAIPCETPYLEADERRVAKWRARLDASPGFKVGVAWQGNPNYELDRHRSLPLRTFEALANVPGVQLVSLQKGRGSEQVAECAGRFSVIDWSAEMDASNDAFLDTAATIRALDLVVTSDTAVAHLAGALAAPTWLATAFSPDWRWLLGRDDSPWYPTMRLFRQRARRDWAPVMEEMADELRKFLARD